MPKNKGRNAFFFFMADWKRRAEVMGRTFPNGFKDVQADPECNEEWQKEEKLRERVLEKESSLSKQEKRPFETMAKKDRIAAQISSVDKQTSLGESVKLLEMQEEEQRKFIDDMNKHLNLIVDGAVNHNVVPQLKFCFIHVNWFFTKIVNNSLDYFPAEYAIGVFSLEKGIEDIHHMIVSTPIPLGYRREALETSQSTHNVPVESEGGETDFSIMYQKLVEFLEPRKMLHKYPPLYTTRALQGAVQSLLMKLSEAAGEDKDKFLVYEIEALFKHLALEGYKNRTDREIIYIPAYAEFVFNKLYKFLYKRGNECSFHKYVESGSELCSKFVLHQWTWMICDELCEPFNVNKEPGVHCPKDFNLDSLTRSMADFNINEHHKVCNTKPECSSVLSMTGVSEQHRIKVSERTYEDEIRRRKECKPVVVIDHSKSNNSTDDTAEKSVAEQKRQMRTYLNERQIRPPYSLPFVSTKDDIPPNDKKNFPPIGGRGVLCKTTKNAEVKKVPLGRGQGFA